MFRSLIEISLIFVLKGPICNKPALIQVIAMMTSSFSALLALCVGNSPITGGFPAQMPVTWSFDVTFDEQTVEQPIKTAVISDAITLNMTSL